MILGDALSPSPVPSTEVLSPPKVIPDYVLLGLFITQLTSQREAITALLSRFHVSPVRWLSAMEKAPSTLLRVIKALNASAGFKTGFKDLGNLQGGSSLVCSTKSLCGLPWFLTGVEEEGNNPTKEAQHSGPHGSAEDPWTQLRAHHQHALLVPGHPAPIPAAVSIPHCQCLLWHPRSPVPAGGRCTHASFTIYMQGEPPSSMINKKGLGAGCAAWSHSTQSKFPAPSTQALGSSDFHIQH